LIDFWFMASLIRKSKHVGNELKTKLKVVLAEVSLFMILIGLAQSTSRSMAQDS
jgi:hypothetical protein